MLFLRFWRKEEHWKMHTGARAQWAERRREPNWDQGGREKHTEARESAQARGAQWAGRRTEPSRDQGEGEKHKGARESASVAQARGSWAFFHRRPQEQGNGEPGPGGTSFLKSDGIQRNLAALKGARAGTQHEFRRCTGPSHLGIRAGGLHARAGAGGVPTADNRRPNNRRPVAWKVQESHNSTVLVPSTENSTDLVLSARNSTVLAPSTMNSTLVAPSTENSARSVQVGASMVQCSAALHLNATARAPAANTASVSENALRRAAGTPHCEGGGQSGCRTLQERRGVELKVGLLGQAHHSGRCATGGAGATPPAHRGSAQGLGTPSVHRGAQWGGTPPVHRPSLPPSARPVRSRSLAEGRRGYPRLGYARGVPGGYSPGTPTPNQTPKEEFEWLRERRPLTVRGATKVETIQEWPVSPVVCRQAPARPAVCQQRPASPAGCQKSRSLAEGRSMRGGYAEGVPSSGEAGGESLKAGQGHSSGLTRNKEDGEEGGGGQKGHSVGAQGSAEEGGLASCSPANSLLRIGRNGSGKETKVESVSKGIWYGARHPGPWWRTWQAKAMAKDKGTGKGMWPCDIRCCGASAKVHPCPGDPQGTPTSHPCTREPEAPTGHPSAEEPEGTPQAHRCTEDAGGTPVGLGKACRGNLGTACGVPRSCLLPRGRESTKVYSSCMGDQVTVQSRDPGCMGEHDTVRRQTPGCVLRVRSATGGTGGIGRKEVLIGVGDRREMHEAVSLAFECTSTQESTVTVPTCERGRSTGESACRKSKSTNKAFNKEKMSAGYDTCGGYCDSVPESIGASRGAAKELYGTPKGGEEGREGPALKEAEIELRLHQEGLEDVVQWTLQVSCGFGFPFMLDRRTVSLVFVLPMRQF